MNRNQLFEQIKKKKSFLCVGLDTDIKKIPQLLLKKSDPIFSFNKEIIDATCQYAVAYKPNIAFYESLGAKGWESLEKTVKYIKSISSDIFVIADAKRGDIGNTSGLYARAFFEQMDFDAITVAPYMGKDSVMPFLEKPGKWVILLALTSNKGSNDFQLIKEEATGELLFEKVLKVSQEWGSREQIMFVVGATKAEKLAEIRKIIPDHFLLVPGIGAQGGSLEEVAEYGLNDQCGLLVNSSRGIIFASNGNDFAQKAAKEAEKLQVKMESLMKEKGLL